MATPLDDAAFLVRSEHRARVLELVAERPRSRTTLTDETGVSRVTLGRTLGDLEDRNWIERNGHDYEITSLGRAVAEDLAGFLDTLSAAQQLRTVARWLPIEELAVDISSFGDARITLPGDGDLVAPLTRLVNLTVEAEKRVLSITYGVSPDALKNAWAGTAESVRYDLVVTSQALGAMADNRDLAAWFRERIDAGWPVVSHYDDDIPCCLVIVDDTVAILLVDGDRNVRGLLESTDDRALSWAESTFERHRREATPVTADMLGF